MGADFPVILDANVLAESAISDLFLRLSEEPRLISPRWTDEIWEEVRRTMLTKLGWPEGVVVSVLHRMAQVRNKSLIEMLSRLSAGIPTFTAHVSSRLGLQVPPYSPSTWKTWSPGHLSLWLSERKAPCSPIVTWLT